MMPAMAVPHDSKGRPTAVYTSPIARPEPSTLHNASYSAYRRSRFSMTRNSPNHRNRLRKLTGPGGGCPSEDRREISPAGGEDAGTHLLQQPVPAGQDLLRSQADGCGDLGRR